MQISGTEVLASIALVVSVASAFYAKRAVDAAIDANRVGLHQPRAEIFKAIFEYRTLFVDMDMHPTDEEMQDFYRKAILPAHLYLPTHFTQRMHELYARSRELYSLIEECEAGRSAESKWNYIHQLQDLGRIEVDKLIHDLASELDLGNT
ncbi:hypothetical protein ACFW0H_11615 [Pseudomonas sp. CR3202]|uniref:hypothetical protein n=1 Tax=Pseudomonas sp. CR3202 TaxID=3351532 RepID=UPI003BEF805C